MAPTTPKCLLRGYIPFLAALCFSVSSPVALGSSSPVESFNAGFNSGSFSGGSISLVGNTGLTTSGSLNTGTGTLSLNAADSFTGGTLQLAPTEPPIYETINPIPVPLPDLSGSAGIIKMGAGTLILAGSNSYSGSYISGGTLQISNNLSVSAGTVLTAGALNLNPAGAVLNIGAGSLVFSSGADYSSNPILSGGVIKTGSGSLTLNQGNTIPSPSDLTGGTLLVSGAVTSSGGTLHLSSSSSAGSITIVGGGSLNTSPLLTANNLLQLTQSSGYTVLGAGSLAVTGPLTYAPAYVSDGNTLRLSDSVNLPDGSVVLPISGATLILNESALTGSGGVYTLPAVLSNGATFSSILVIRPPTNIPIPPVVDPPITLPTPPNPEPPINEPPFVVNTPPVTTDRSFSWSSHLPLSISATSLATDTDGDTLRFAVLTPPAFGNVTIEPNKIIYTPLPDYLEGDSFTLRVSDTTEGHADVTVTLTNPFAHRDGVYFGTNANGATVRVTFDRFGTGTFKVAFEGKSYGGTLAPPTNGMAFANLPSSSVYLGVSVPSDNPPKVQAVLRSQYFSVPNETIECRQRIPAQIAGEFTGQFNVGLSAPEAQPPYGFAIVAVKSDGSARATGRLPNGKAWAVGGQLGGIGELPISVPSSKGTELLSGEFLLPPTGANNPIVTGSFSWSRPSGAEVLEATGSRFVKQTAPGKNIFGEVRTKAQFLIDSPALATARATRPRFVAGLIVGGWKQSATMPIAIDGRNRVTQLRQLPPLTNIGVKPDGRFSGTYVPAGNTQFLHFSGVLLSDRIRGYGVLTGSNPGYILIDEVAAAGSGSSGSSGSSSVIITVVGSHPIDAATWATSVPTRPNPTAEQTLQRPPIEPVR